MINYVSVVFQTTKIHFRIDDLWWIMGWPYFSRRAWIWKRIIIIIIIIIIVIIITIITVIVIIIHCTITGVFDHQKRPGVTNCHWWDTQLGIWRFVPLRALPIFLSSVLSSLLSFFITLLVCFVPMLLTLVEPHSNASQFSCCHSLYFLFGVGVILRESDGRNYYNICFNESKDSII